MLLEALDTKTDRFEVLHCRRLCIDLKVQVWSASGGVGSTKIMVWRGPGGAGFTNSGGLLGAEAGPVVTAKFIFSKFA